MRTRNGPNRTLEFSLHALYVSGARVPQHADRLHVSPNQGHAVSYVYHNYFKPQIFRVPKTFQKQSPLSLVDLGMKTRWGVVLSCACVTISRIREAPDSYDNFLNIQPLGALSKRFYI